MRSIITFLLLFGLTVSASAAESIPPLPQAVSSFGAAVADGYVYIYGGHAGKTHSYSTETTVGALHRVKLDNPKAGWEELPGGERIQGLALVAYGPSVIRIGGMEPRNKTGEKSDNHSISTVAKFDPAKKVWTKLPDLPSPRSSHDAVVIGDTLFVFGGWHMKGKEKSTWYDHGLKLDLRSAGATWEKIPQPFARRALTAAMHDGKVYVICGLTNDGDTSHDVNVFDPKIGSWSKGPTVPGERMNGFTPAACVCGSSLYLSPADGVVYKLSDHKWEETGKLQKGRWVHRVVSNNGELIVLGGASKDGNVATVELVLAK